MAKFRCVCGEPISTSGAIPNPLQWLCISDVDYDAITGTVDAEELYQQMTLFFRCPRSDHLWIYWDGLDRPPSLYTPEGLVPHEDA